MNTIELMLSGKMKMNEFINLYKNDVAVRELITELIPNDAKYTYPHTFWKSREEYEVYARYNFDMCQLLDNPYGFYLSGRIGSNYSLHSAVSRIYLKSHPDFVCTTKYSDLANLYLNAVGERYEGDNKIQELLEKIILSSICTSNKKSERKKIVQEAIVKTFHVENNKKYPRWIQGGEWPMGEKSPMKFISQRSEGEETEYIFQDVDTEEIRIIKQYY